MIKLTITLLLAMSLLAPLHSAGAPAHGSAGGDDAAPATSTRRSTPSSASDNVFALCQATQRRLHEQFPVLTTDTAEAIGSERLFITGEQIDALKAVVEVLQTALARPANKPALVVCDTLANDARRAMQSVFFPDTSDDAIKLKQLIAEYHKAQKLRATGPKAVPAVANPFKLSSRLLRTMTSFLDAPDLAALAATNSQQDIQSRLLSPDGTVLTKTETMLSAQFIFKNHEQPNSEENYSISLPCAMQRLTKATVTENAADIEKWNKIVTKLIDERQAPFRIAFEVAQAKLAALTEPDLLSNARDLLAEMAEDDLLNRMALCLAWSASFPGAENLDTDIKVSSIIQPYHIDYCLLDFRSLEKLAHREAITQLIIDFVLNVIKPIVLRINNPFGAVTVVSNQLINLSIYNYRDPLHTLNALDACNCPQLKELTLIRNPKLTSLNLSNLPQLQNLNITECPLLTALDLSTCSQLKYFTCYHNPSISVLDFSKCPELEKIDVGYSRLLTTLDLSTYSQLKSFSSQHTNISVLDFSKCPELKNLYVYYNPRLTALDVSKCPELGTIDAWDNPSLTGLDVSNCTKLRKFFHNTWRQYTD